MRDGPGAAATGDGEVGEVGVLVVDDQAPFRAAARAVLRRAPGFRWVGEAGSGDEAVRRVAELDPDLVLMDIRMPGVDGVAATGRIRAAAPSTVVFLCSSYERADLPEGLTATGAAAYLHKEELDAALLRRLWAEHAPPEAGDSAGGR